MLMLSRKPHESITLLLPGGGSIRVLVKEVHGNRVSIGVEAPKEITILRNELLKGSPANPQNRVKQPKEEA